MTSSNEPKNAEQSSAHSAQPAMPRWVKVSAAGAIVLLVLFIVLHVTGHGFGGHHGGHMSFMHHG